MRILTFGDSDIRVEKKLEIFAFLFLFFSKNALAQDSNLKKVISEQTAQWSAMTEKQRKEEWELLKNQTQSSRDELKRLIEIVQATQIKQMQAKHDKSVYSAYLCIIFLSIAHKVCLMLSIFR